MSVVAGLAAEDVLWVGDDGVAPAEVRGLLGRSFDAVVLDLHAALDADRLGQCHGFVWGGGALVLRLPPVGEAQVGPARLAAFPFAEADVGQRFRRHLERALARARVTGPRRLEAAPRRVGGTSEQARVVERLAALLAGPAPAAAALVADRGRGKSSALGLALGACSGLRVAVTAGSEASAAEVLRFAPAGTPFVPVPALLFEDAVHDVIVVDEAAQLPVPVLQRIVERHRRARLAFATTTHGYEGTGRGFSLRFLAWLARERQLTTLTLEQPIRWDAGDPVERFVFDALLLDAEPAPADGTTDADAIQVAQLDRDALVDDELSLRDLFGLLVQAHYRTTPGDLHRLLDAPNLDVHALRAGGRVVGATLVAREGQLPTELCDDLYRGRCRILGHALPETFACHLGHPEAGALSMARSVRIAVHPGLRRRGLATRLVEHVQRSYDVDLFGTVFGATPELLRFRREVGYEVARVGASHGSRTGEPAVVLVRPVSPRAQALMATVRAELARDLPLQLTLLQSGGELLLDADLLAALTRGLPAPAPLPEAACRALVHGYAYGPRTLEAVAVAVTAFVEAHRAALDALDPTQRALLEGRVLARESWAEVMKRAGLPSVRAAMRGMRRAVRALLETGG